MTAPRVLVLGAHPDDADLKAGGTASKWRRLGCEVKLVSVTDGRSGHQTQHGAGLALRRRAEAQAAGAVIGASYDLLDNPDGGLLPTLEARINLIRLIRNFRPDLILTHRPNDYHPDHRYTSVLVQDAAYMITVPAVCPDAPHLESNPVILYFSDDFRKPAPFIPDVIVDIGDELSRMMDMLHCHKSQFYEWLPYNGGYPADVPADDAARRTWLEERMRRRLRPLADRWRSQLLSVYGDDVGRRIEYVEAFEASEYGAPLDAAARARLFPFVPTNAANGQKGLGPEWPDVRLDD
jgi:LmbE family N-acetylglucosaminyl deacetylase